MINKLSKYLLPPFVCLFLCSCFLMGCNIKPLPINSSKANSSESGSEMVATFITADGTNLSKDQLNNAKKVLEQRLKDLYKSNFDVNIDYNKKEIIVTYPYHSISSVSSNNDDQALHELGASDVLTFRDSDGNVLLTNQDLIKATVQFNANGNTGSQYVIGLEFTDVGKQKFADATTRLISQNMGIYMDDIQICNPKIDSPITDGKAQIEGDFTPASAEALADKINAGSIPFKLKCKEYHINH